MSWLRLPLLLLLWRWLILLLLWRLLILLLILLCHRWLLVRRLWWRGSGRRCSHRNLVLGDSSLRVVVVCIPARSAASLWGAALDVEHFARFGVKTRGVDPAVLLSRTQEAVEGRVPPLAKLEGASRALQ